MMKQVFCHCASVTRLNQYQDFYEIIVLQFFSLVLVLEAGLKPLTSGWWSKCSVIALLSLATINIKTSMKLFIFTIFFFCGSVGSWTQTLDLRMMKSVICPYASVAHPNQHQDFNEIIFLPFFSSVLVLEAGIKPLTSGWWSECSVNALLSLATINIRTSIKLLFDHFFLQC